MRQRGRVEHDTRLLVRFADGGVDGRLLGLDVTPEPDDVPRPDPSVLLPQQDAPVPRPATVDDEDQAHGYRCHAVGL
ncbi:hypothetical protein GCM10025864_42950 [Luteimicrobium album]|uniref:Uncharacterized protein n=1 Tax=Luteimicrobium album TaxID=1054550 RepID=A0ABQ6I8A6_9MICO|nr:hypothetical protein GCM10025864_42950 [Luteimicrobium album]